MSGRTGFITVQHRPGGVVRLAGRSAAAVLERSGYLKLRFQRRRGLRIVCYHGVCADDAAGEPWVPGYFVSASAFAGQLAIMKRFGPIVHLPDVVGQLKSGAWTGESCLAVTFDDVAACTFRHARDILAGHGIPASFFVSSGHASTGRLFPADVVNLLRLNPGWVSCNPGSPLGRLLCRPAEHKLMRLEELHSRLDDAERIVRQKVDPAILETLRPMDWGQIRELAAAGHDIGGHTVDHSILGRQSLETRRSQISDCLAAIEGELGHRAIGFAYPNGGPGDFGEVDYEILREHGIEYAGTTRAGFCGRGSDFYALPRVCLGRGHAPETFALEISGLLDRRRKRQQGWL